MLSKAKTHEMGVLQVIGPTKLCPQGIEMVLVDLDGTLLVRGVTITNRTADALTLARERGCMVCISTGRCLGVVPKRLRLPETVDYLICANGASVYDTIDGPMREQAMPREQVLAALDALAPLNPGWNTFIDGHAYFEWRGLSYMLTGRREPPGKKDVRQNLHSAAALNSKFGVGLVKRGLHYASRFFSDRDGKSQVRRIRPQVEKAERGVSKLGCSLPSPEACDRAVAVLEHMGCFELARVGASELEITAKGVNKGASARWLMDHLNVKPERVVAFGDSENDAPLIDVCGAFVAMGNADERVKARATDVCESNRDNGVARWLERAMAEADGAGYVQD